MEANYYNEIAKGYNELHSEEQKNKNKIIKSILKSKFNLNNNSTLLDVGCGTGISSNFNCNVIGIDPSKNLIEIAKKDYCNDNHKFIVEKAENIKNLNFKEKQFDFIISVSAIHHVENLNIVLDELIRIGNVFVITILNRIKSKEKIINIIKQKLKIIIKINEDKDIILFLKK